MHLPGRAIVTYSESDLWAHLIGAVFTLVMMILFAESSGYRLFSRLRFGLLHWWRRREAEGDGDRDLFWLLRKTQKS